MRFGSVVLGYSILTFILFMFGIVQISDSFVLDILINGTSWNTALFNKTILGVAIESLTALMGIVLLGTLLASFLTRQVNPDRFVIFGVFTGYIIGLFMTMLYPIINVFPSDIRIIGYLIYGILSFMLIWTGVEFWGGSD